MQVFIAITCLLSIAQAGILTVPHSVSVVNSQRSGDSFTYSTYQGTYPSQYPVYQQLQYPVYQQPQLQQTPVLTSIYQGGAIYHTIPGIQFSAPGAAPVGVIGAGGYPVGLNPIYGNPGIIGGPIFGQPVTPVQPQDPQIPVQGVPDQQQPGLPVPPSPVGPPLAPPGPPAGPPPIIPDGPVTDDDDTVAIDSA